MSSKNQPWNPGSRYVSVWSHLCLYQTIHCESPGILQEGRQLTYYAFNQVFPLQSICQAIKTSWSVDKGLRRTAFVPCNQSFKPRRLPGGRTRDQGKQHFMLQANPSRPGDCWKVDHTTSNITKQGHSHTLYMDTNIHADRVSYHLNTFASFKVLLHSTQCLYVDTFQHHMHIPHKTSNTQW